MASIVDIVPRSGYRMYGNRYVHGGHGEIVTVQPRHWSCTIDDSRSMVSLYIFMVSLSHLCAPDTYKTRMNAHISDTPSRRMNFYIGQ